MTDISAWTWLAMGLMGWMAVRTMPALIKANGHRPFILAFIILTLLYAWGIGETLTGERASLLEERRVVALLTLVGAIEWARRKKH